MVVDVRHKKLKTKVIFFNRFSAENDCGTVVQIFELYGKCTVRLENLKLLTEHKPACNNVTRTRAKYQYQQQQRPLALLSASGLN